MWCLLRFAESDPSEVFDRTHAQRPIVCMAPFAGYIVYRVFIFWCTHSTTCVYFGGGSCVVTATFVDVHIWQRTHDTGC